MADTFWHKQTASSPLFPDLLWSRPQNRAQAGKLLIIGGNSHGFAAPAEAYAEAVKADIGAARVLLPDVLNKTVSKIFPEAEYAHSNPSGSFAQSALAEMLEASDWADGVLLAGGFGKNSETAILLERFVAKYSGIIIAADDGLDYFLSQSQRLLTRPSTTLVPNFSQLQKLAVNAKAKQAFTSQLDLLHLVEVLHEFSLGSESALVLAHTGNIFVATGGQVSTTKVSSELSTVMLAANAAVWQIQNPAKAYEALTSSVASL